MVTRALIDTYFFSQTLFIFYFLWHMGPPLFILGWLSCFFWTISKLKCFISLNIISFLTCHFLKKHESTLEIKFPYTVGSKFLTLIENL